MLLASLIVPEVSKANLRPFSPTFFESSETGGLADHANGGFAAVSRERFLQ